MLISLPADCEPVALEFVHKRRGFFRMKRTHPAGWSATRRPFVGHSGNVVGVADYPVGSAESLPDALRVCEAKIAQLEEDGHA